MTLHKPKLAPLRRAGRKSAAAAARPPAAPSDEGPPQPARAPDEHGASEPIDIGWRASSYDLKQGLDVVELPTSLPPEVLDRLFKAPKP